MKKNGFPDRDSGAQIHSAVCREIEVDATKEKLPEVLDFIGGYLEKTGCSPLVNMQIHVAVEEIFVNIASYAYGPSTGKVQVRFELLEDPLTAVVTFTDQGDAFDPLALKDPDVTLPASEREIGGLGIFMTKKIMDEVTYENSEGNNILRMIKKLPQS